MRAFRRFTLMSLMICLICLVALGAGGCARRPPAPKPDTPVSGGGSSPPPVQPPAVPNVPAPDPWLRGGDAFPNGITGCWPLPNGSVLVESPGKAGQQYHCIVTAEDKVEPLTPDSWDCVIKEIQGGAIVFVRRNNPAGASASPDVVTFSAETLKQTGTQAATDLTIKVAKQPAARPELEPVPPYEGGHDAISRALGKVEYCWLLPDGTVLLADHDQMFIFRWYPRHNDQSFVAGDAFMATVIEITDDYFRIVCTAEGPTAHRTFPYLITYDLKTCERSKPQPVFLPVTAGVDVGWPKDHREVIFSNVNVESSAVALTAEDKMFNCPAEYHVKSDPSQCRLVIEMPGVLAKDLKLPLELTNQAGLIKSVRVESGVMVDGVSGQGATVYVNLDAAKWDRLTYSCDAWNPFTLTVFDDRQPTDISVKVGPGKP